VPFAAGGAVDGVARLIGKSLATNLDQPIVIENRGGAGGIIDVVYWTKIIRDAGIKAQ
jgi:tripartite-type tricarboxylate transporter receptor subunit TctC